MNPLKFPLKLIQKGEKSMIYADVANVVIRAINAILKLEVSPQGAGKFEFAEGRSVLSLDPSKLGGGTPLRCNVVVQSGDPPVYSLETVDLLEKN